MPDQIQLRGGTAADNDAFTGVNREVTVDTTNKTLRVHDGVAAGGHPLIQGTASSAADADTIALRDAWGRLQVADPQDDQDAANKVYVDAAIADSAAVEVSKLFTASGTWTPPAGVSSAIAECQGGGASVSASGGSDGDDSSVAFDDATVTAPGGKAGSTSSDTGAPGTPNSGQGAWSAGNYWGRQARDGAFVVGGGTVTAGAATTVTVGAGGAAGTGVAGGSGFVRIRYYVAVTEVLS